MKSLDARLLSLSVATLFASSVQASGHIPPMPMPTQSFASFDACVEKLRQMYAEHMTGAKDGPQPFKDSATREKKVDTEGVASNGRDEAHYNVEVGWEIRAPGGDAIGNRWIMTNYTYERFAWTCSGATLSGTREGGFASPGFQPVPQGM
ncbi:hypothetical protein PQR67_12985 [Paraburkholderia fungorum]|uniref:hypothetical protein n=1 Tax=Paraburkholderia fungorum TaxID=134537 RepID=UPI0038BA722F